MIPSSRRPSLVALFALFAALSFLLVAGACVASRRETRAIRAQRYAELHAIATLKIGQLVAWRNERLGDARTGAAHLADREAVARWLAHPDDASAQESILQDLSMLRDAYGYRTVALLGTDGRLLLALDPPPSRADIEERRLLDQTLRSHAPVLGDIFRERKSGELHLDVMAPVQGPRQQPLAVLLLRSDPEVQLFPLIQTWPMPSATAETTLVRREGDLVRWLNLPRHTQAPPLSITLPISRRDLSAVQVVLGRSGEFLGLDYRGAEVLADLNAVPDSPWFLISKVDTREIMGEAHYRTGVIQGFAVLGILLCAMLLGFLFYLGEAKLYHGLFQATRLPGPSNPEVDVLLAGRLRSWALYLGLLGLATGLMVLLGWILDVPALQGTLPGFAVTKANTALGMMLAGAALACLASSRPHLKAARTFAILLLLLGGLTLVEHAFGLDLHIDQALVRAPSGMYGALAPGRMAPVTALNFILAGSALCLASFRKSTAASQWIALSFAFLALSALLGHLLGPFGDFGLGRYLQMTFPAVATSFSVALGVLFLNPGDGFVQRITTRSMGGWMLRHLMPVLIGMPLLVAWIGVAVQRQAWLEPSVTAALSTVAFVALLLAAAWWAARSLDHLDAVRNQAEADLCASQSKLQLLLDSTAEAIYGIDLSGDCTFCNRAFLQMMGYPSMEQVLGRNMHNLVHHSHGDGSPFPVEACRIFLAFQEGKGTHVDDEVLWRSDGTSFAAEYWSFPQFLDGRTVGAVVTFIDITQRRHAQEALRESREMLSHVLDTIPQSVFWKDLESRYLGCNRAFARQVGLDDPAQIAGRTDFDLPWPQEEVEAYRADDREVMNNNQPKLHILEPLQKSDGSRIWIKTSKVPLRGADGRPCGVLGVYEDVTGQKRLEEALQASEVWHRTLVETAMDGYMVVDREARVVQASEALARMTGYPMEELARMRIPDLEATERPEEIMAHIERVLAQGSHRFETRQRRKDGSVIDVEVSVQVAPGGEDKLVAFMRDISERKRAEDELRTSRTRLAEAQALAHLGNWDMDLKTRALQWSDESFRIFGLDPSRNEATYELFLQTVHPENRQEVENSFQRCIAERTPYCMTSRLKQADGTIKFVDIRGQASYGPDGSPLRITGTMQDITDLKRAEMSLRESEERLRVVSDNLPGGMVYQVDSGEDGSLRHITYASAGVKHLHGVTAGQLEQDAMLLYSQILPEDAAGLAGKEAFAIAAMVPFSGEYRVRHPSGEIRWYFATSSPRKLANNHLVWDGIELDISSRKRTEQALETAYTEQQLIFQNMINAFVIFESVFDANGKYVSFKFGKFNEAYSRISKLDLEAVLGKDVFEVWPETEQSWVEIYGQVATTGIPRTFDLYHTPTKGWYHCNAYRPTASPDLICVIFEDITEKKAADSELHRLLEVADHSRRSLLSLLEDQRASEAEIRRLNVDLEQRVEARTRELAAANKELEAFAYSVSHDLRAPLRHMDGFLSMLARHLGDHLDAKGAHYLKVAQGAAVRMGLLVDGLLSFSRLGRAELRMVAVDTGQVVASVIDEFRTECGERSIAWKVGTLPRLHGDPTLLRLVFQNLIGNALKFTRNRSDTVIEIQPLEGLEREDGLYIRDNGVGFDPAYAHKLFGVFQRLHREDEFEGTGIGLANVHRIMARHGGRVWAEGRLGQGATFCLAFPAKEVNP